MHLELYELAPTRSQRCRWTLLELDLPFESIDGRELMGTPAYREIHPLGKLPALVVDGRVLFESAAICTWLADQVPQKQLIAAPGTWERAQHDQWVSFALTEIEAWMWSTAKNTGFYPPDRRVPAIAERNAEEVIAAAGALEQALAKSDYLVAGKFSVTDIIASYALNWARMGGLLSSCPNLIRYLDRLYERPLCTLTRPA
jgi:glutathione S-transferase